MPWVVDTCVVLDVLEGDPSFGLTSANELDARAVDGLTISPVTFAELAPAFDGDRAVQIEFLAGVGIDQRAEWEWGDTLATHDAWSRHVELKRSGQAVRRPIADVLIGAYASRRLGLITRNVDDFRATFPDLNIINPTRSRP